MKFLEIVLIADMVRPLRRIWGENAIVVCKLGSIQARSNLSRSMP